MIIMTIGAARLIQLMQQDNPAHLPSHIAASERRASIFLDLSDMGAAKRSGTELPQRIQPS